MIRHAMDLVGLAVVLGALALPRNCAAEWWIDQVSDAQIVASRISDALVAPPELVSQVEADLAAIRDFEPRVRDVHALRYGLPGYLFVVTGPEGDATASEGMTRALALANSYCCVVMAEQHFDSVRFVFFPLYTPRVLGPEFLALEGVVSWSGDPVAGDGDDIVSTEVGRYRFIRRWGSDCLSGCSSEHGWEFVVQDGEVALVDEWGAVPNRSESFGTIKAHYSHD